MSAPVKARRGTATVELAVLMIVLVPTIMYTLFLNDLLYYRMKQQETIISTTWDFTAPGDFTASDVQTNGRQTYIDHTGEWNTYTQPSFDSNPNSGYHQGLAAHECWLVTGAVQVTCTNDGSQGLVDILTQGGGGLGRCRARLGVLNYFLQQNLFGNSNFGRGQVTMNNNKQMYTGDGTGVHGNAGGAATNYFMFPEQSSAVLHNTWNIDGLPNIDPYIPAYQAAVMANDNARTLYLRVLAAFGPPMALALSDVTSFMNQADDDFLGPLMWVDGTGDTPGTPDIAFESSHRRQLGNLRQINFMSGFGVDFATGWNDPRQQTTYNRSQDYYMRRTNGW